MDAERKRKAAENYRRVNFTEPSENPTPISAAAMEFVFGTLWDAPGLSWRERRLISLCCTAINAQVMPLEMHVRGALKSGDFTVEDLQALSVHLAAYAGFPVGTAIEMALRKVLPDGQTG
jgi:4-carboxymuconolactone decarboxylase